MVRPKPREQAPMLHTLLVHTIQEAARDADIIRESIDGAAGRECGWLTSMRSHAG